MRRIHTPITENKARQETVVPALNAVDRAAAANPASLTGPALSVDSVSKWYGDFVAVRNVSFDLPDGQFFSLLGPSGCGKTTLIKLIAGFEDPTSGEIRIGGTSMADVPAYNRPVNTVFQNYALFPHMNVIKNVGYALRQHRPKIAKATIAERVNEALVMVQLDHLAGRRAWELSGGQQQRVALARALIAKPSLLLLDEPLSALDARLRVDMQSELKSLQHQLGISFVFVTHDQSEALSMSDRIAVLRDGEVVQDATPFELYDKPIDTWVANFIGSANLLAGVLRSVNDSSHEMAEAVLLDGRALRGVPSVQDLPSGQQVSLAIRPERVQMTDAGTADGAYGQGAIDSISFHGDQIDYVVTTDTLGDVKVRVPLADSSHRNRFRIGTNVGVAWRDQDARIVPSSPNQE